jgi:hypothetical protein
LLSRQILAKDWSPAVWNMRKCSTLTNIRLGWGVQKLKGENLKLVWAEFSTIS